MSTSTQFIPNPCCGLSLKTATKSVAVFQVVMTITVMVVFMLAGAPNIIGQTGWLSQSQGLNPPEETPELSPIWSRNLPAQKTTPPSPKDGVNKIDKFEEVGFPFWANLLIVLSIVVGMMVLLMASINLFKGARDKIRNKCKIWMAINILLFLLLAIIFGLLCFHGVGIIVLGVLLVAEVLHGYFIVVVNAFTQQI